MQSNGRSGRSAAVRLVLSILALTAAATAAAAPGELQASAHQAEFEQARQAFRAHRYAAAYGRLSRLADAGHVPSAELARTMHLHGAGFFGQAWAASEPQQRRWSDLVERATRERSTVDDARHAE